MDGELERQLRDKGYSSEEISKMFGVTRHYVDEYRLTLPQHNDEEEEQ